MQLPHFYGVAGHRYSDKKFLSSFSHVCFAGMPMHQMTEFHLICKNPLSTRAEAKGYWDMMWMFLNEAAAAFGNDYFKVLHTRYKADDPETAIVVMKIAKGSDFRKDYLMPGTVFRYASEHPSCVYAYYHLRQLGMPVDLALSLCVSVYYAPKGVIYTCEGSRGTGHSLKVVRINYLDKSFRMRKAWQSQKKEEHPKEKSLYYVPNGCVVTGSSIYTVCGASKPSYGWKPVEITEEKIKEWFDAAPKKGGKVKAQPKFDVNFVLEDA